MKQSQLIEVLEQCASRFWADRFDGDFPPVQITVQKVKSNINGHCTRDKVWHDGVFDSYEVNINPVQLKRGQNGVLITLLHELVHVYNAVNGVKDTSRAGTYHNNRFKDASENVDLTVEKTQKYGWSTSAATQTDELLSYFNAVVDYIEQHTSLAAGAALNVYRDDSQGEKAKKQTSFKHVCPVCGAIARTSKFDIRLTCTDCDEPMEITNI